jgi:hypothetical protein
VDSTGVVSGDPSGVAHRQHTDPVTEGEADDLAGRLVVGLVETMTMAALNSSLLATNAPPAP